MDGFFPKQLSLSVGELINQGNYVDALQNLIDFIYKMYSEEYSEEDTERLKYVAGETLFSVIAYYLDEEKGLDFNDPHVDIDRLQEGYDNFRELISDLDESSVNMIFGLKCTHKSF